LLVLGKSSNFPDDISCEFECKRFCIRIHEKPAEACIGRPAPPRQRWRAPSRFVYGGSPGRAVSRPACDGEEAGDCAPGLLAGANRIGRTMPPLGPGGRRPTMLPPPRRSRNRPCRAPSAAGPRCRPMC
jgi:hypothetical protein